jgi:hypothetical protein
MTAKILKQMAHISNVMYPKIKQFAPPYKTIPDKFVTIHRSTMTRRGISSKKRNLLTGSGKLKNRVSTTNWLLTRAFGVLCNKQKKTSFNQTMIN